MLSIASFDGETAYNHKDESTHDEKEKEVCNPINHQQQANRLAVSSPTA
jgi:hypothetical protein